MTPIHEPILQRSSPTHPGVLLVDDDLELSGLLADYLRHDGFHVELSHDGHTGLEGALSGRHEIVVMDVMMPVMTGIDALRSIRAQSGIPVLMLTARGDETDRVVGLELGADDYLAKPCSPRELSARLRAILRRMTNDQPGTQGPKPVPRLASGRLTLWPTRREATWDETSIALTATEFNLLEILMRNAGSLVNRDQLYSQVLGMTFESSDRSIDVHVSRLRQKLAEHTAPVALIKTVRGRGYLFAGD